ncbi:MAG: ABC transporter substrate-binding protein, partial [Anaerolineae bacterium]|nr:ABC transporter substrate-binding protein [Anaerolineae bacterium]
MKTLSKLFMLLLIVAMVAGCGATPLPEPTAAPTAAPTQAPAQPTDTPEAAVPEPTEPPAAGGLTCDEPIKIGLITDKTGALALYGE